MAAGITWLYADSDADTPAQTKTASGLSFQAGDRILVAGFAFSNGNGSTHNMGVTDTATTNDPTWATLVSSAYNTLGSASFPTRLTLILSSELTANETFDVTLDYQTGSANTYYGVMGVARVTGTTGTLVRSGSDIGAYRDDDASCNLGGAATTGNLVVMVLGHGGPAPYTYDAAPTNFAQISGSTSTTTGNSGMSAISSTTTTASTVAWGYEAASNDAEFMCAAAIELEAAGGGGPTTYPVSVSGSATSVGSVARRPGKPVAGSATPTGLLARQARRAIPLGGANLGPTGVLIRRPGKAVAGSVGIAGALARAKVAIVALVGAVASAAVLTRRPGKALTSSSTPAGALTRRTARTLTGTTTSAGALARRAGKALAGVVTSAGTLSTSLVSGLKLLAVAGSVAASAVLARQPRKALAATVGPTGALTRRPAKVLAGAVASSSTLARVKVALIALAGTVAPAGALARRNAKAVTGQVAPAGATVKRAGRRLVGAVSWAGTVAAVIAGTPTGWAWSIRRGGVWVPAAPTLDGSTTTTTVT